MKKTFTVAVLTPTTTTQALPQQQVAAPVSLLDSLLVYAPLIATFGLGPIIAACITIWGHWQIHRSSNKQGKRGKIAADFETHLANESNLLNLENDPQFYSLIQHLSSADKNELSSRFSDYKKQLNDFENFELPKLRAEAKKAVETDLQMLKNVRLPKDIIQLSTLPADTRMKALLYSDYRESLEVEAREKIEEPLRTFLAEALARLKS